MIHAHVRFTGKRALPLVLVLGSLFLSNSAQAQFTRIGAVGGVKVDADGVISHPEAGDFRELKAAWQAGLQPVPPKLDTPAELRFVSLRNLEAEAAKAIESGQPLPE